MTVGHLGPLPGAADPEHQAASFTHVLVYWEMLLGGSWLGGGAGRSCWQEGETSSPSLAEAALGPQGSASDEPRSGDEV